MGTSGYLSGNADRMVALGEACSEFAVALDYACFELATNVGQRQLLPALDAQAA
ncbi:hypothetical protein D3C81_1000380 [compost metagenome]